MVTESTILCVPCGYVFTADSDDEVVQITLDHARDKHDTVLRSEDVRQAIRHSEKGVSTSKPSRPHP